MKNAIIELVLDIKKLRYYSNKSYKRSKDFRLSKIESKYTKLYSDVLSKKN